jgi:predicted nucleic acid-binding protein
MLPETGKIYLDANCFIYSVERIDPYREILDTLWQAVSGGQIMVITSELTLLEVLVKPLKVGDIITATIFRMVLQHFPDVYMLPISQNILEESARLRATSGLKTPDALHVATAILSDCALFLTNDYAFRRVSELNVVILDEVSGLDDPE